MAIFIWPASPLLLNMYQSCHAVACRSRQTGDEEGNIDMETSAIPILFTLDLTSKEIIFSA
jgi:hypothetical protein